MDDTSKPYDKTRPFQRINSPSYNHGGRFGTPDGVGHSRGCRRARDFMTRSLLDGLVRRRLIAMVPSWVTVEGADYDERAAEKEVYGRLARSFQTWTDAPPFQWHNWYDWNLHIEPEVPFEYLCTEGNEAQGRDRPTPDRTFWEWLLGEDVRQQNVVPGHTMECELDTGALGDPPRPGPMFQQPGGDGKHDWAWPMKGDYAWILGRWIYDGGHELEHKDAEGNVIKRTTRAELHPCKAVATARWEAFKFKENNLYVPAIQFMFFTSRFGGYIDFPSLAPLNGGDYEFIVDLPEAPEDGPPEIAIGHTPDFPYNTVVLRKPELLKDFNFAPFFDRARGRNDARPFQDPANPPEELKPVITECPVSGTDRTRRQVRIRIPIGAIAATRAGFYGVIISLGWRDDGKQSKKVRKCTFQFENLWKGNRDRDTFKEEWRLKAGVNGRWRQWDLTGVRNSRNYSLTGQHPNPIVIHLHEDDALRINCHGAELDLVDDIYLDNSDSGRTIRVHPAEIEWERRPAAPGIPPWDVIGAIGDIITGRLPGDRVVWNTHIDKRPVAVRDSMGVACHPEQRAVVRKVFTMMWTTFNDQNEPLGIIDPDMGPNREAHLNPLKIKSLPLRTKLTRNLSAYFTWELGDLAELIERPHQTDADAGNPEYLDYVLTYSVTIENQ